MIYFTSDLHFNHNKSFLYASRGFDSVEDMNTAIISNWNRVVDADDVVYVLGDLMLGDLNKGLECMRALNGKIVVVRGNHDTDSRIEAYRTQLDNVIEVCDAKYLKYGKYHFYLTHFPCLTSNLEKESLSQGTLNLSGHTHSSKKFFYDLPYVYNVACDAHDCTPVSVDEIIQDMKEQVKNCISSLE